MTDVARPCLLDRDQVALVDVVMIVNRDKLLNVNK